VKAAPKIVVIADEAHKEEVLKADLPVTAVGADFIRSFNKNKKKIKKWSM
jgi:hypothetical protein